jgi:hypothetical protein
LNIIKIKEDKQLSLKPFCPVFSLLTRGYFFLIRFASQLKAGSSAKSGAWMATIKPQEWDPAPINLRPEELPSNET